jgi:hypothetical protein
MRPMTAQELIEALGKFPPSTPVYVYNREYDCGCAFEAVRADGIPTHSGGTFHILEGPAPLSITVVLLE